MLQISTPAVAVSRPLTDQDLQGDLIHRDHPLFGIIWINPQRMSGVPCFAGTRVPIKTLFEYLEGGEPLEEFLTDFEGVTRPQAEAVISLAAEGLFQGLPHL
jgi:uncharacterized protein (DUF433 family)